MRNIVAVVVLSCLSLHLSAQSPQQRRTSRPSPRGGGSMQASAAEGAVKQAMEMLVPLKKNFDRDLEVLQHLNTAEEALGNDMQPHNAMQKASDEVDEARRLAVDYFTVEGLIKMQALLEQANRSPAVAEFARLRALLHTEATGPAQRAVARNGSALQEEILAWIKVQELISSHLRAMTEISAESVRATTTQ
jgi:hypothetical protein